MFMRIGAKGIVLSSFLWSSFTYAANINITTKYGDTGGIIGSLNNTTDKINGRTICPTDPTAGCDFAKDPGFNNGGTVDDSSDDSYSGDLLVRTNDAFQAVAAWNWNGGIEDTVTITGTLPLKDGNAYYEWTELPGACNPANSSISDDKQTIVCEREDFDKSETGTKAEDLTFNIRVLGGTPSGIQPGDITFKVEAPDADPKTDTTDGNSLTVTAAPRWNLQKSIYTAFPGKEYDIDGDGVMEKGWILDYKFYIESDEVSGETDSVNPIVGNESMGKNATFTFTDDMSGLPPHATVVGCGFTGSYSRSNQTNDGDGGDGYNGSTDPISFSGAGSIHETGYPKSHIPQPKNEQTVTCSQSGASVAIKVEHIDATLDHYPTKDYVGRDLPVNRAIAAMGNIYIFVPLDDVKNGKNGIFDDCDQEDDSCDDGEYGTHNVLTGFDPTTPTGNSNFGDDTESEKDNYYNTTLYYSAGSWSKYYRGTQNPMINSASIAAYIGSGAHSGDGMVTANTEFSTWMNSNNKGGTRKTKDVHCDVFDAYRLEVQPIEDNKHYKIIGQQYAGKLEWPYRFYLNNNGDSSTGFLYDADKFPYTVEYANSYVDDSFLPSRGGDTTVNVGDKIIIECSDASVKWYTNLDDARSGADAGLKTVTKIRYTLKDGIEIPSGGYVYLVTNHKVRETDLKTGEKLKNGDLIVDYATHYFDDDAWSKPDYKPGVYPGNHSGGWNGDRVIFTGPKVRIKKKESRTAATLGDEVTYTLEMSYTNDTGLYETGQVNVADVLPKDFKYIKGSISPMDIFGEPTMGTCADITDISTTCVDGENQVLLWDLGEREVNSPQIEDLNYTTLIGASAKVGVNTNIVKIESPTDASPVSQRKADIGLTINVPASINIVKSTEENPDYPSKRERTTEAKDILFLMDMRNGKDGDITDLDVIDILPFDGDGEKVMPFNDIKVNRKKPTSYHGSAVFHEASFSQHPGSSSLCDYEGKIKYYYTNEDSNNINLAPTVGNANDISSDESIWCEGDESGPNGCNGLSNSDVTAVRVKGARLEKQALCQFRISLTVKDNLAGDNYSNSAGASATGVTLPVLSNSIASPIVGSSLGDILWYDRNANGLQDEGEEGISGIKVSLLDGSGNPVKNPANPTEDYVVMTDIDGKYSFDKLNNGNYSVKFDKIDGYLVSDKTVGENSSIDSNINKDTWITDVVSLGVDKHNLTIDAGVYKPTISGTIFDDGNHDGTVNGSPIAVAETQLFAMLLDDNGTVLSTKAIAVDGTYIFNGDDGVFANSNYKVVLSTTSGSDSALLPAIWNNADGEHIGTNAGLDNTPDGEIIVEVKEKNVPEVNFGINKKPVALNVSDVSQFNPSSEIQVNVADLKVSDKEDDTPTIVTIKSLPSDGILYYSGVAVTEGQVISNFDNTKLTVDPKSGDVTVQFNYTTTDKSAIESDEATVTMPFENLKILGHLFDDGNGDDNINGTAISSAKGTQLYVTLVNDAGVAVASKVLATNGTYSFDTEEGVAPNKNYTVVLSESNGTTEASLPENWNNADGENVGLLGNDGQNAEGEGDGLLTVSVGTVDVVEANFGINKKPIASDKDVAAQLNPGIDTKVVVPTLSITDNEDGTPTTITIKTLADDNSTLYYDGVVVTVGEVIIDYDSTKLMVDPVNGDTTVKFNYTTTDKAGVESDNATVTMPFTELLITGNLYEDGNGNNTIDGTKFNKPDGVAMYATLIESNGTVLATTVVAADGSYSFDGKDGIRPNTTYFIVMATTASSTVASLPVNWGNEDGEHIGTDIGTDGTKDGQISVAVTSKNIAEINFGINKKPVAKDLNRTKAFNPGADTKVTVPTLIITDKEDGVLNNITIKTLPLKGTLYYNDVAVVVGQEIIAYNPSQLKVDPIDGDQLVTFTYLTIDAANVESDIATVNMPFVGLGISGSIYDDGNNDNTINGIKFNEVDGSVLYATLLNNTGVVLSTIPVNTDGTYVFNESNGIVPNQDYSVVLSIEGNVTVSKLPINWGYEDGEHIGTDEGTDKNADGIILVSVGEENIPEVNFGINKKPMAEDMNNSSVLNPGGEINVVVPTLAISDKEDSKPTTVTIKTLPSNGVLYYNGTEVTVDQVILDYDSSKLTVDPINGKPTIIFTYSATDRAGIESETATVVMPLREVKISGTIFNDGNGNENVDGLAISRPEGAQLYATLVDENNTIVAAQEISMDGTYMFDGIDGVAPYTNYTVVLSDNNNSTVHHLPNTWNPDGENVGLIGKDANKDGLLRINVKGVDIEEANFGINKQPVVEGIVAKQQFNPNGNIQVQVPDLNVTDSEDGTPSTVTIKTIPTNGILYYDGTPVIEGDEIPNFDNDKLMVDPDDGTETIVFTYTSTDNGGVESKAETVRQPFVLPAAIGNRVWFDELRNGIQDTDENGTSDVNVTLYDANDTLIASTVTDENGDYLFSDVMPGAYYLGFENFPQYYLITEQNMGNDDYMDSDVNKTTHKTVLTLLESGEDDQSWDLGLRTCHSKIYDDTQPGNANGRTTVVNVTGNDDEGVLDGQVKFIDTDEGEILWGNGTAVGGTTTALTDSYYVVGEGNWTVNDNGAIVFNADPEFDDIPTPVYYVVEGDCGRRTNVASVTITSPCNCDTYKQAVSDSVSTLNYWSILWILLSISALGGLLARREFELK